ncbi:MAG TPA: hypothetical protein VGT40_18680 [Methylomirabilota bacterium]|jgi:hypothetical protein|nr:hypothetical protein [Methylomirabilota bacterium]
MLLKIGAVLASIPMALGAVVAGTGVMVVDVKEADGTRIVVPVPLLLAETAARFAPTHAAEVAIERQLSRVRRYLPVAEEFLAAVAESPDFELARVDDGDEHVRVNKVGDLLQVRVESPRETVNVNVPFDLARQALRQARGGRVSLADLVAALRRARLTRIADVRDGGDHVTITIW